MKKISIKPYVDKNISNMGLEKYDISIMDGVTQSEPLGYIERHGIPIYITGLNEFSPKIQTMDEGDEKNAKIKDIRSTVAELERKLAANVIKEDDPEFWNKVKLFKPDNISYWKNVELTLSNKTKILDPAKNPDDLIIYKAIKAGGFTLVAPSYKEAKSSNRTYKFYLDDTTETLEIKNKLKRIQNRAATILDKLDRSAGVKMLYIAKLISSSGIMFNKNTPADQLYNILDEFIKNADGENAIRRNCEKLFELDDFKLGELKLKCIVADAISIKLISIRSNGQFSLSTGEILGKNVSEIKEYLENPLNSSTASNIIEEVEKYWNK